MRRSRPNSLQVNMTLINSVLDISHCSDVKWRMGQRPIKEWQTKQRKPCIENSNDHEVPVVGRTFLHPGTRQQYTSTSNQLSCKLVSQQATGDTRIVAA